MKKYIFSALASAAVLFSACEKNFDVDYTNYMAGSQVAAMVEQDPEFLSSYVSGLYTYMVEYGRNHDDFGYLCNLMLHDFMGQDIVFGSQHWGLYDYMHDYGAQQYTRPFQFWSGFYTLVNNANAIIDFFGAEDPQNPTLRGYLGQAYAMRALAYTNLCYFFQDPIAADGTLAMDKPCFPLIYASRDGISEDYKVERSGRTPLSEVCKHIEENIALALPLLQGYKRSSKNEIDYSVAQGLAARYYLFSQQWEKAAAAAAEARQGYNLMDNARLHAGFNEIEDAEVMWGFNHTSETSTVYASFFSHMSSASAGYGGASGCYKAISAELYSKINNSDYRKSLFNGPDGDAKGSNKAEQAPYSNRKFGNAPNWLGDYIYMRAAEMYLIEAESYARLGRSSEANNALATLMKQRDPAWARTATVDEVLLQRRIELWGEGFSTIDLIRCALPCVRRYEGSNHPAWAYTDYPAHDLLWFFQIPLRELDNNPAITEEDQTPLN